MYRVTVDMTFDDPAERDKVYSTALKARGKASKKAAGRIERHTCNHDNGKPCTDQAIESWEAQA